MSAETTIFTVAVEAFAALGIPVTLFSSLMAFVRTMQGQPADDVSEGVNLGLAVGFVPGTILAIAVFVQGLQG